MPSSVFNKRGFWKDRRMWATVQRCPRPWELKLLSRKWDADGYELWRDLFFSKLVHLVGARLMQKSGQVAPVPSSLG